MVENILPFFIPLTLHRSLFFVVSPHVKVPFEPILLLNFEVEEYPSLILPP